MKLYRSLARPYDALADAFRTGNFDKLKAEAEIGQSIWHMASSYLLQAFESFIFTFLSLL